MCLPKTPCRTRTTYYLSWQLAQCPSRPPSVNVTYVLPLTVLLYGGFAASRRAIFAHQCGSWKAKKSFDLGFFWSRNTPLSDIEKQNVSLGDCLSVYVPTFPSATFIWRAEMEKDCAMKFSSCSFAPSHFVVFSCLPAPSLPWQAFQLCISDENSAVQTTEFSMRQFSDWAT